MRTYLCLISLDGVVFYNGHGNSDMSATYLSLSGTGVMTYPPDIATLSVGVTTEAETLLESSKKNREKVAQLHRALNKGGIDSRYIQTRNFSISPKYGRQDSASVNEILGYTASNQVQVKIKALNKM